MRIKTVGAHLMAWGLAVGVASIANAQTFQERLDALENKVDTQQKGIEATSGIDIHFMTMFDYNYSFNHADNQLSTFNFNYNSFDVRQATLFFSRDREDESFGFSLVADFGSTADAIAARWGSDGPVSTNLCGNDGSCKVEIREAFLTYKTPLSITEGSPITLKAGKFVTLLGYEVIPTWEAFNDNISTSILFGFSIPFTHTGLLANVPINDVVSFDIGVVNGWDDVKDKNNSKTMLGGIKIAPLDSLSFYIAGTYGAEQQPKDEGGIGEGAKTGAVTVNGAWHINDMFTLAFDSTYADVNDALPSRNGTGTRSADWYGVAGYFVTQITDDLGVAFRTEWFDDPDGFQTGIGTAGVNGGGTFWEITPTVTYKITDHIVARTEYRHDEASRRFFPNQNGKELHGQDLLSTEFILAF
jgi:Putative beta-barrel porin-2, OmpL-like. bbp2